MPGSQVATFRARLLMDSFRIVGLKKDNLTPKETVFGQVMCRVNLKTRYVYQQVLSSRSFDSIKTGIKYFLNLFDIDRLKIFCDAELSFRKLETIHGYIKAAKFRKINFAHSHSAKQLMEDYSIHLITHQA